MLENVLDNSGLRFGIDYKREVSFTLKRAGNVSMQSSIYHINNT